VEEEKRKLRQRLVVSQWAGTTAFPHEVLKGPQIDSKVMIMMTMMMVIGDDDDD
jgi:hypothetical protein